VRQARRNRGFFGFGLGGGDPDAEAQRRLQQLQDLEVRTVFTVPIRAFSNADPDKPWGTSVGLHKLYGTLVEVVEPYELYIALLEQNQLYI
jgi:hypothetical protein